SSAVSTFVLLIECVGINHRAKAGSCLFVFWTLSLMLLALLGYLFRDWRMLSIAGAVPGLLQIFFWWFIPESSRSLIVRGKADQATKALSKVARFNRKEMPANPVAVMDEKQRVGDVRDLFRSFKMARITLVTWLCSMVISMLYYGALFSAGSFGGNRYFVFFLTSLVEIPSHFAAFKLMNRVGRRKTMSSGLVVSAIASIGAVLLQRDLSQTGFLVGRITMAMISMFFLDLAFDVIYIYSAEIFPTVVRSVGMGTSSAASRIGSIAAPFIVWLVRIHVLLPYSIFAISAFIAGVLCLTLPETMNAPTKEIFEENQPQPEKDINGGSVSTKLIELST
ncbi:hypothetical protein QZH41_018390, partial [Actinostola sp. cb2023]